MEEEVFSSDHLLNFIVWLEYINNKSFNVNLYKMWFVVTSLSNMKKLKAKLTTVWLYNTVFN